VPQTKLIMFKDEDNTCPLLQWILSLEKKAKDKCFVKIKRLAELGHELRRPEADFLRDGIYELRTHKGHVQYRMLYFFHGNQAVVVTHGLIKEDVVPPKEIDLAVKRMNQFKSNPKKHTWEDQK